MMTIKAPLGAFFALCLTLLSACQEGQNNSAINALAKPNSVTSEPVGTPVAQRLKKVVDGDTLILSDGRKVRLLGINTPEMNLRGGAEPLAKEATKRLRLLLKKRQLGLVQKGRDDHGRILAYAFADDIDVQQALLADGLAFMVAFPPDLDHVGLYQQAEDQARAAGLGIWNDPYYALKTPGKWTIKRGFNLVSGKITGVGRSKKYVRLRLQRDFALLISHDQWRSWFTGDADDYIGVTIEARGWVVDSRNEQFIKIRHPSMLKVL